MSEHKEGHEYKEGQRVWVNPEGHEWLEGVYVSYETRPFPIHVVQVGDRRWYVVGHEIRAVGVVTEPSL